MSESKSVEQITKEFSELCLRAGNLQFEIELKQKDLSMINEELKSLNFQYMEAKNAQAAPVEASKS